MFRSGEFGRFEVSRVAVIFVNLNKSSTQSEIFLRRIIIRPMRAQNTTFNYIYCESKESDPIDSPGEVVKTGISSGKIGKNGKSYRAEKQVRRWAKEKDEFGNIKCGNCVSTIIGEIPAGAGARARALGIESSNAAGLRAAGQLKDKSLHQRP
jgi:hypothetical protein